MISRELGSLDKVLSKQVNATLGLLEKTQNFFETSQCLVARAAALDWPEEQPDEGQRDHSCMSVAVEHMSFTSPFLKAYACIQKLRTSLWVLYMRWIEFAYFIERNSGMMQMVHQIPLVPFTDEMSIAS